MQHMQPMQPMPHTYGVSELGAEATRSEAARPGGAAAAEELRLLEGLRRGDEAAFVALVERYHLPLVRLALAYVPNRTIAEEAVQETWQGVLKGLPGFEGRSSLKTWIFRILTNRAKSWAEREARAVPFSAFWSPEAEPAEPAVDPERFRAAEPWKDHWASLPHNWDEVPEERFLARETRACVQRAIAALPPAQREVITLRDVEQWTSEEVCSLLEISEGNQRVLLHRARAKVRRALEEYLGQGQV
jgi:RNA polymerase sigma-70 factor (ECF subfamily)